MMERTTEGTDCDMTDKSVPYHPDDGSELYFDSLVN